MARGRMINRKIATSRKISACTIKEQWFYFRLMPFVDDEGRLPGDLFELKNFCFPAERISEKEMRNTLIKLHNVGLVLFEENSVIEFVAFMDNQKIGHRPSKSLYPEYQEFTEKGEERLERSAVAKPALTSINLGLDIKFKSFYSEYPKKVSKQDAIKAFNKLNPDDELMETIMSALRKQKATWDDPKFIKHPSTWLNGACWEDEIIEPKTVNGIVIMEDPQKGKV